MLLFLLLPWILFLPHDRVEATHLRVHSASAFKLQCESMPYRSHVDGNICYFAITNKVTANRGDAICAMVLSGSRMFIEKRRDAILKKMFLALSEYHDLRASEAKSVLCAYDAQYSCEEGDMALPGRCLFRSNRTLKWQWASTFCHNKYAIVVMIHNELENSVIAGMLSKNESGWLYPRREKVWGVRNQDKIDYWNWFFERQTPADLKCSNDPPQAPIITNNAKRQCASRGLWKVDDEKNYHFALCMTDAQCPLCPVSRFR